MATQEHSNEYKTLSKTSKSVKILAKEMAKKLGHPVFHSFLFQKDREIFKNFVETGLKFHGEIFLS